VKQNLEVYFVHFLSLFFIFVFWQIHIAQHIVKAFTKKWEASHKNAWIFDGRDGHQLEHVQQDDVSLLLEVPHRIFA
jgi:hypothetical protein